MAKKTNKKVKGKASTSGKDKNVPMDSDVKVAATPDLSEEKSDVNVDVPGDVPDESNDISDELAEKNFDKGVVVEDEAMETDDNVNKCDNETNNLNTDKELDLENMVTDKAETVENSNETNTEDCTLNDSVTITENVVNKDNLIEIPTDDSQLNTSDVSSSNVSINEIEEVDCTSQKKKNTNEKTVEDGEEWTVQSRLESFMKWTETRGVEISSKVAVKCEDTSHRYGMVATTDIKKGEVLCTVPRSVTLHPDNSRIVAEIVDYEDWLDSIGQSLDDSSGWATLLITLMLEFNDINSFWAPYLRLVPQPDELGHPLFWSKEECNDELKGTTLLYDVQRDVYNIESEYKQFILPFIYRYKDICGRVERYDLALYKRLVAFVMSYSFTEDFDSQPAMVPVADMLNHSVNNNAHLLFGEESLKVIALKKIEKGEEIFNTFGKLGNAELLQMYGYADKKPNIFDTLPMLVNTFLDAMENIEKVSDSFFQAKVALLNKTEIAPSDDFFLFDRNGMRKGPDIVQMLKILFMPESEFEELLKSRCGNRPDSFYKKLLRKLNLAKRTDTSSGVAIIDITDEDQEQEPPPKRKLVIQHDMEDDDEPPPKRHNVDMQDTYLELAQGDSSSTSIVRGIVLQHQFKEIISQAATTNGNCISNAICIDDSDDDDDGGGRDLSNNSKAVKDPKQTGASNSDSTGIEVAGEDTKKKTDTTVTDVNPVSEPITENADKKSEENNEEKPSDITDDAGEDKEDSKTIEEDSHTSNPEVNKKGEGDTDNSTCKEDSILNKKVKKKKKSSEKEEKTENTPVKDNEINIQGNISAETKQHKDTTNTCTEISEEECDEIVSIGDDIEDDLAKEEDFNDSDIDDIEFVSEDIRCKITYGRLANELKPEWKTFIKSVLKIQSESIKQDEDMTVEEAQKQMSERQFYAYQVRQGQRTIVQTFLSALMT